MSSSVFRSLLLASASLLALSGLAQAQDSTRLQRLVVADESRGDGEKAAETDVEITEEDLERVNAPDLRSVFATTPEIAVTGGGAASQRIYVHGLDQSKVNVQIDGARQSNGVWHHNGTLGVDPFFLKSVELEAGVSPADSGPGALGGSLKFETKDAGDMLLPGRTVGGTAMVRYDTNSETVRGTAAGYGKSDGFEFLGILTRGQGNDYKAGNGMHELYTAEDLLSGLVKGAYESAEGHRFEISGEYFHDEGLRRLRPNLFFGGGILFNEQERKTAVFQYTDTSPSEMWDPEIVLYYNNDLLLRPMMAGSIAPTGDFNSDNGEFGGKAQNTFTLGAARITAGFDFYDNTTEIERYYFSDFVSEDIFNIGGFLQARFDIGERIDVSTGLRIDHQSYRAVDGQTFDNTGLSPNITVGVELIEGLRVYGGFASVFGGLEKFETALAHARDYTYDPAIQPARAANSEIGVTYARNGFSAGAKYFHTRIDNPVAIAGPVRISSTDDLVTEGFDLFARYEWARGFLAASFSSTEVRFGNRIALPSDIFTGNSVGDILSLQGAIMVPEYGLTFGASIEHAFSFSHPDLIAAGFFPLDAYTVV
ncbi:MAG: TonB-dependent receptor, partial [Flavobacteriaceae bacterium]